MLLFWFPLCLAASVAAAPLAATTVVDYTFNAKQVSNPDGSLRISLPDDTQIVDGPGTFQDQSLPKAARVGQSAPIDVDISTKTIGDASRFHVHVVFSIDSGFDDRNAPKMLVESNRLPIQLGLYGQADSTVKLAGGVRSSNVQWRSTETYSTPTIEPGKWYAADLVYDTDTLVVFLDGKAISCHGFGQNGAIAYDVLRKSIAIGGRASQSRFSSGKIAAFMLETTLPPRLESLVDEQRQTTQWYITTKLESNRLTVDLGQPTGPPTLDIDTVSWVQTYPSGAIMYHAGATSAFEIYGLIWKRYQQLPKSTKRSLGFLASDEIPSTKAGGRKSVFRGGGIYWSPATSAFEVLDKIYLQYEGTEEASVWGFPLEPAQVINGGLSQRMQHAVFYHKNGAPSAHEVHGFILQKFQATGGIKKWGWPASDETIVEGLRDCPGASGGGPSLCFRREVRLSEFENASFYWSAATGACNIYGHIRVKWLDLGGPTSPLGLPTTDELDIPGGGRYNGFEKGAITWYGSFESIEVVRPFKLYIGVLNTRETEGWTMGQNDLYFRVTINKGTTQVFRQRFPGSGDFGGHNVYSFNQEVGPVLDPSTSISFAIDVWESDRGAPFGGGDEHIGTWTKTLDASNAWGLREDQGIFNSGRISRINSITAAVHPQVDPATLTEYDKFFGADNVKFDPVDYQSYAEAFRDVDSSPEWYDPLDWLDGLFYELVIKHMAKDGRCFGMSLEAINARNGASIFSMPINRFTSWDVIGHVITVKQLYQAGAASVWFFVGQFLSGKTHDPVDVFNDSERSFLRGNPTTLNLAQKYTFNGAPHSVMPFAWDRSVNPAVIKIHDPNKPGELRDIKVDLNGNSFSYENGNAYNGGRWSGGRLYYTPWSVVNSPPRTPIWDSIVLLAAGTVAIMGSDTETVSITNAKGEDLSAHGSRATAALQENRSLNGYFVNAAVTMGNDAPTEMLFSRGSTPNINFPPPIPLPRSEDPDIGPRSNEPLDDFEKRSLPSLTSKTFNQTIQGKPGARIHSHLIKTGHTHVTITSPISAREKVLLDAANLNTARASLSFTHAKPKTHEVNLMHRLGASRDAVRVQLNLTTGAGGTFKLAPRPGLTMLDLHPGATRMTAASMTLTVARDLKSSTYSFDLVQLAGKSGVLRAPVRVKITAGSRAGNVTVATLDASGAVVGSRRAIGSPVAVDRSTAPDPGPDPLK